jgi:hypothetical protein
MKAGFPTRRLAVIGLGLAMSACTYEGFGSPEGHFATFSVPEPKGATVHVCHAYGCKVRTKFTFTAKDLADIADLMRKTRGTAPDTPEQERRAVAYAIGWIETRVGDAIGTRDDRPGMDFAASGDPTQQDCVDEATNTTSYLTILQGKGLIRFHTVTTPFAKENFLRGVAGWTHWTAVLVEKPFAGVPAKSKGGTELVPASPGGQRWAVDSWIYANGENPAIVRAEEWYISSLEELPQPKR